MDWTPALLGFVGALIGSTLPVLYSRRNRREDAYTDLAGSVTALLQRSIGAVLGGEKADEDWVRFGACRARLWLREKSPVHRAQIQLLGSLLRDLYSVSINLDPNADQEEERGKQAVEHLAKMKSTEEALDKLLDMA